MKFKHWNWGGALFPYFWVIQNRAWNCFTVFFSLAWLIIFPLYVTFFRKTHEHGLLNFFFQNIFNLFYDLSIYPKFPLLLDIITRIVIGLNGSKWGLKNNRKSIRDFKNSQQLCSNLGFGIGIPITALIYLSPIFFLGTWL